jgi:hypothetical protein
MRPPADDPNLVDPSDEDIEAWAEGERQRRAAWLEGPTEDQKAAWAREQRQRRALVNDGAFRLPRPIAESAHVSQQFMREWQLATEGAMNLFWKFSMRGLNTLVREGQAWEAEHAPRSGRRVRLDDAPPE